MGLFRTRRRCAAAIGPIRGCRSWTRGTVFRRHRLEAAPRLPSPIETSQGLRGLLRQCKLNKALSRAKNNSQNFSRSRQRVLSTSVYGRKKNNLQEKLARSPPVTSRPASLFSLCPRRSGLHCHQGHEQVKV